MPEQIEQPSLSRPFLGRGWAFPPAFRDSGNKVDMLTDVENVQQSIRLIFATYPGERVERPDFGCNLSDYAFHQITQDMITGIEDRVNHAIRAFEHRITLHNVSVGVDESDSAILMIDIDYTINATNSRYNMVLPYYLNEARVGDF